MPAGAKSMSERLPKHLHDAVQAARHALAFLGSADLAEYQRNALMRSAVERQVEIVGEACRRALDDEPALRLRVPEMALAIGTRNRVIHAYDRVEDEIVLNVVRACFPLLIERLQVEIAGWGQPQ